MDDFVKEYTSEAAFGDEGYLSERGLIPLSPEKREEVRKAALEGTPLSN
jgi:phosphate transport system substrate-binding protein